MSTRLTRVLRALFRDERIPARVRWWFAAQGLSEWYSTLAKGLAPHLGGRARTQETLARIAAPMFARRYALLRETHPLPDAVALEVGTLMGGLYRVASQPEVAWMFDEVGGAPVGFRAHLRAERMMSTFSMEARWEELTSHLGEVLIALTEALPAKGVARARAILGDICFDAGQHAARRIKRAFALGQSPDDAMEVLRMSEYVFRVNPQHWQQTDASERRGYLEGTACPWYTSPGWNAGHCGIFGQFQSGIASVFGLRYLLTSTIPKHGGHTCRIDLKPIDLVQIRREHAA